MHLTSVLVTACAFFSIANAGNRYHVHVGYTQRTGQPEFAPNIIVNFTSEDELSFDFIDPLNAHSVVESTFTQPCVYKEGGIRIEETTGIINITTKITENPTVPHFFASKVGLDCKNGMVLMVNHNRDNFSENFFNFRENARKSIDDIPVFDPHKKDRVL